jgi:hypothetical protein
VILCICHVAETARRILARCADGTADPTPIGHIKQLPHLVSNDPADYCTAHGTGRAAARQDGSAYSTYTCADGGRRTPFHAEQHERSNGNQGKFLCDFHGRSPPANLADAVSIRASQSGRRCGS